MNVSIADRNFTGALRLDRGMRRSFATLVRATVLGAALVLAGPGGAGATVKAIWGPVEMPDGSSAFPIYRNLGVDVFQIQLSWRDTARMRPARPQDPADPAYTWPEEIDEAIAKGRRYGIKVAILVIGTPGWANGSRSWNWAPDRASDYADFVAAASRRYRSVHRWMIWGEPCRQHNFQPLPVDSPVGPRRYAQLLDAAYVALKRRSRRNIVIGGNTFSFGEVKPARFLRFMRLPSGRRPRLDQFGHNPLGRRFPNLGRKPYIPGGRDFSDIDLFAREVRHAYRRKRKRPKLWLSEYTISSDHPTREFDYAVSRKEQARWLGAAFRIADRLRYVSGLGWVNLIDEPASQPRGTTTGLMTYEGARKPAFYAYRRAK